mgnify:FL=1
MKVSIENLQDKVELSESTEKLIKDVAKLVLETENIEISCKVDITLVDDAQIREFNNKYRNIDSSTDVLSFPIIEGCEGQINPEVGDYDEDGHAMLGDIIISLETARKQAEEYGHSFERELGFLVTHGMLHLLGFDHEEEEQEKKMLSEQEKILTKAGLTR